MATLVPCPNCDGDGWTTESAHHPTCDGSCGAGMCPVPVQEQCAPCQGEGYIDVED